MPQHPRERRRTVHAAAALAGRAGDGPACYTRGHDLLTTLDRMQVTCEVCKRRVGAAGRQKAQQTL